MQSQSQNPAPPATPADGDGDALAAVGAVFGARDLASLLGPGPEGLGDIHAALWRARLAWLRGAASDLAGAYDASGARRWLDRARPQLGGLSPRQALGPDWDPAGPAAGKVRALAAGLAGPRPNA